MKEFNDGIIVVNNLGDDRWAVNIGESHIFTAKTEEEVVAKAKQWRESYPHQIGRKAEVEPLAVLADRKGYHKVEINCPRPAYRWWRILLQGYPPAQEIIEDELADAELKARQYLEGLPDRKGE